MKKVIFSLIFVVSGLFSHVFAQESNPDSLFLEAKKSAEYKNYDLAIKQMNELLFTYPENRDYSIYLASLYYWSEKYDLAQNQVLTILAEMPSNEEAFDLLVRIEAAAKKSNELLAHSEQGMNAFPENIDFYKFHKALALVQLDRDREALLILTGFQKTSDFYPNAQYLKTQLLRKNKNSISMGYLNTTFSNPGFAPWHFGMVEYMRKMKNNALVGRVNYGALFGISGLQVEVDGYRTTGKNSYLYLNVGVSDGKTVFPSFRLGTEYYQNFKKYTASIGGRYLHFDQDKILLFTGHLGRNLNTFNLSYRPFLVNQNGSWFASHVINLRKNYESKESFVQLDLQYGAVPYYFFVSEEFLRTNAFRAGVNCRFRVKDNFFIQPIFMYEFEEFIPDQYRNRFNFQLILSKRF